MPMIDADGCRINVEIEGPESAPVLMLSNSLGTNLHMWDTQAPAFTKHFRLVRYDRRGHGKSDVPKGPYSMERLGRDVLAVLDALGIRKINWCGLSMGGMVGMWLGANAPERIERLVLSNTAARFPSRDPWNERIKIASEQGLTPLADATMERWFTKGFRDRHPEKVKPVRDQFLNTAPDGYIGCCHAIRDMDQGESIRTITAPTLIIAGRHDPGTTVEAAEFMHDRIKGSKLEVLDAAHISNIEQTQAYNDAVLGHLTAR
ncbi:MAG TPA: 3-oxoadipate enol-lactonase [Xanthobacteraceae bacterium]|nr:3-oxoadipate enol-lactonase [Xanthobacteraceae bacterium]